VPPLEPLTCVRWSDRDALLTAIHGWGIEPLVLDGAGVTSGAALWKAVGEQLPMPEGLLPKSWDGLKDILFEVLSSAEQVALVWDHAEALVTGDLQDFIAASEILSDVIISAARERHVQAWVLLVGEGAGYRPFDGP
jgi:hypothetical protein